MEKIDFSVFNKPKYFPEWLCSGDTLKLAQYDDEQLEELDKNIRSMSSQFDIDNATGAELDRIGKILGEERNGNTDKIYRIYLKLRTMLNTADGTVEDIIKFVKFFFSSEVVHLVPNYPAGLRILHDGFNDTVDFNRIIKQIVGAGIAYDTRELFNMKEEFPIDESDEKRVHRVESEYFARNAVFHDGRVLRDGLTDLKSHFVPLFRNGEEKRNGVVERRNTLHRVKAIGEINIPVLRNSGILDLLALVYAKDFIDEFGEQTDEFAFDRVKHGFTDSVEIRESDEKTAVNNATDTIGRGYKRDSSLYRNKKAVRASDRIVDICSPNVFENDSVEILSIDDVLLFDKWLEYGKDRFVLSDRSTEGNFSSRIIDDIGRKYKRNRNILRNNSVFRCSNGISDPAKSVLKTELEADSWEVQDDFAVGKRYWYFRDEIYTRNGNILRQSGVLEDL